MMRRNRFVQTAETSLSLLTRSISSGMACSCLLLRGLPTIAASSPRGRGRRTVRSGGASSIRDQRIRRALWQRDHHCWDVPRSHPARCVSCSDRTRRRSSLYNHNPDYVLGRPEAGTLTLTEDKHGLKYDVVLPDTAWARDLHVSIKRGDVSQSSFSFRVAQESWVRGRCHCGRSMTWNCSTSVR